MARTLDHLELPRLPGELPRRRVGGGRVRRREDKEQHGRELIRQTEDMVRRHSERTWPAGISPALVFKLNIEGGALDDETLARMGLRVISREPTRAIVVFASDQQLQDFRRRLSEYTGEVPGGHEYAYLGAVESVEPLSPRDRLGALLRERPLTGKETIPLDVELWHPGTRAQCQQYVDELAALAGSLQGRVSDSYLGDYLCVLRCHLNARALAEFLSIDYVKEVDRLPMPTFETSLIFQTTAADIGVVPDVQEDAPGVLVVDSGVMGNHPLLSPALGEAEVFPDRLGRSVIGGPDDGDRQYGHGTAVSGIAVYGSIARCLETRTFAPEVRLFSARVTDDNGKYDEEQLFENQLGDAVAYFLQRYPQCRVINISLGDARFYYRDGSKQFRLAARIDELAYAHRENNVVFVISTGNYHYQPDAHDRRLTDYPGYLLSDEARVIDPGTAAIALTVGSLSTGNTPWQQPGDPAQRCIAGRRGYPSPFTRTGTAVDGMIKPDLVDYGGDEILGRTGSGRDPGAGIPTTSRDFLPPDGRLLKPVAGTSFAAPAVSNLAARLFARFPSATSNLIRALLADSARIPEERPAGLGGLPWDSEVLRVYGYGLPDYDRAAFSYENEVLLVAEAEMALDSFHLYSVPSLPEEFLEEDGDRYLSVTLAYDPPTRHTRGDSYQGVTLEFKLFRNVTVGKIEAAYRDWQRAPGEDEAQEALPRSLQGLAGRFRVDLKPGVSRLKKGTLQKGVVRISRRTWEYDGRAMILAIPCLRKWAPPEVQSQRYAVVVSVRHSSASVRLWSRIRQQARIAQRIRLRA